MFRWHYIPSKYMYIGIQLMSTAVALSKGLMPSQIICANPSLPYGGLSIASKTKILERFKERRQFLHQQLIPRNMNFDDRKALALSFLETNPFPIIAKPDRGVVGIGVRKIDSEADLTDILSICHRIICFSNTVIILWNTASFFANFPVNPGAPWCR